MLVIGETKSATVDTIRGAWRQAAIEAVASRRKWGAVAPRAGVVLVITPGHLYAVNHVYDEQHPARNGTIQAFSVEQTGRRRITGVYVSPSSSHAALTNLLTNILSRSSGRDWIAGDFNARSHRWDSMTNVRGRAITERIAKTNFRVIAPSCPTFHARGRRASSTPDLFLTNVRGCIV